MAAKKGANAIGERWIEADSLTQFFRPLPQQVIPNVGFARGLSGVIEFLLPGVTGKVAVYCPQSYHWAGQLFIVDADRVTPVSAHASDVLAFIVSGGVTGSPPEISMGSGA